MKENIDCVIISAEMLILSDKPKQIPLLFPGDRFSGYGIIDDYGCQLKSKWILTDQVIIHRHLSAEAL